MSIININKCFTGSRDCYYTSADLCKEAKRWDENFHFNNYSYKLKFITLILVSNQIYFQQTFVQKSAEIKEILSWLYFYYSDKNNKPSRQKCLKYRKCSKIKWLQIVLTTNLTFNISGHTLPIYILRIYKSIFLNLSYWACWLYALSWMLSLPV